MGVEPFGAGSTAHSHVIRLDGADVIVERLRQLAGKAWGTVTLVDGPLNGEIAHALARAESIRSLRILGGDIAGDISWLHVVPMRALPELEHRALSTAQEAAPPSVSRGAPGAHPGEQADQARER